MVRLPQSASRRWPSCWCPRAPRAAIRARRFPRSSYAPRRWSPENAPKIAGRRVGHGPGRDRLHRAPRVRPPRAQRHAQGGVRGPGAVGARGRRRLLRRRRTGTYRVVVDGIESGPVVVQDDPYPAILSSLLGVFDANADGREKSSLHAPSHLHDARSRIRNGPAEGRAIDVAGGWMDAGDQLKFTVTIGYAATLLQLAARNQPAGPGACTRSPTSACGGCSRPTPATGSSSPRSATPTPTTTAGSATPPRTTRPITRCSPDAPRKCSPGRARRRRRRSAATALALAAQRASGHQRVRLVRAAKEWFAKAERLHGPWNNCCYSQDTVKDDLAGAAAELGGRPASRRTATTP